MDLNRTAGNSEQARLNWAVFHLFKWVAHMWPYTEGLTALVPEQTWIAESVKWAVRGGGRRGRVRAWSCQLSVAKRLLPIRRRPVAVVAVQSGGCYVRTTSRQKPGQLQIRNATLPTRASLPRRPHISSQQRTDSPARPPPSRRRRNRSLRRADVRSGRASHKKRPIAIMYGADHGWRLIWTAADVAIGPVVRCARFEYSSDLSLFA
jgi:hypothetical protein